MEEIQDVETPKSKQQHSQQLYPVLQKKTKNITFKNCNLKKKTRKK